MKIFGSSARINFVNKNGQKNRKLRRVVLFGAILLFLFACKKNGTSDDYDTLLFSDDTTTAARLVTEANEDLNKIKVMYKKNESQLDELKDAMSSKDIEKVKTIAASLNDIINDGTNLGESALEKNPKSRGDGY